MIKVYRFFETLHKLKSDRLFGLALSKDDVTLVKVKND